MTFQSAALVLCGVVLSEERSFYEEGAHVRRGLPFGVVSVL